MWRLSILVLPWQTRWIFLEGALGGHPWEQGTVAAYASWGVLLLTVVTGLVTELLRRRKAGTGNWELGLRSASQFPVPSSFFPGAAFLVLLAISFFTSSRTATLLWWSHAVILGLFAYTLVRMRVDASSLASWFVLSLVPHAALGAWQFARQDIVSSTLLGIAAQHPWLSGVSVVEHGLYRVLRAYGGFPHPNVFGGWLAVGLTLLPWLARRSRSKFETVALAFLGALFALALVLTFSRGAWLAAVLGIGIAHWAALTQSRSKQDRQAVWLVHAAILVTAIAGLVSQWDHVTARFRSSEGLERWSLEQRQTALREGVEVWLRRPLTGWGPGASLIAVTSLRAADPSSRQTVAPEPPHALPLVILVETGALGFVAILSLIVFALMSVWRSGRATGARERRGRAHDALPLIAAAAILALTDHYLWTLWAGQALAMLAAVLAAFQVHGPARQES